MPWLCTPGSNDLFSLSKIKSGPVRPSVNPGIIPPVWATGILTPLIILVEPGAIEWTIGNLVTRSLLYPVSGNFWPCGKTYSPSFP